MYAYSSEFTRASLNSGDNIKISNDTFRSSNSKANNTNDEVYKLLKVGQQHQTQLPNGFFNDFKLAAQFEQKKKKRN